MASHLDVQVLGKKIKYNMSYYFLDITWVIISTTWL